MRYRPVHVSSDRSICEKQKKSTKLRIIVLCSMLGMLSLAGGAPRAAASGQLAVTPGSVDFGTVRVGKTKFTSVTMINSGDAGVTVSGDTLTGSGYRLSGVTMPLNLRAGASVTFKVCFSPTTVGASSGQLTFLSNAANSTLAMPLSGTGATRTTSTSTTSGYVSATPQTAQFSNVPIGTSNTQVVQLTNTGNTGISVSGVTVTGNGFSTAGIVTPFSLAAGASTQLTVGFSPSVAGSVYGTVGITSNASDSQLSVSLSGTGVSVTKVLAASPTSIAFGNVNLNSTVTAPITLTNSGNSSLTISGDGASGTGIGATGLTGGVTLAPGQSTTLTASFAPKSAGSVTGSVTISSDATNTTSLSVPVTGTGVSTVSHTVALQWQGSGTGVSGYYVYRGTASGGPYTKLNGAMDSGTTYTDSSVNSATTYYYVVTAVATDGTESVYSSPVDAVIP